MSIEKKWFSSYGRVGVPIRGTEITECSYGIKWNEIGAGFGDWEFIVPGYDINNDWKDLIPRKING